MKITKTNVDDYIRELIKKDRKRIFWTTKDWKTLSYFVWSATCDLYTGKNGYRLRNGDHFMGLRHFKK